MISIIVYSRDVNAHGKRKVSIIDEGIDSDKINVHHNFCGPKSCKCCSLKIVTKTLRILFNLSKGKSKNIQTSLLSSSWGRWGPSWYGGLVGPDSDWWIDETILHFRLSVRVFHGLIIFFCSPFSSSSPSFLKLCLVRISAACVGFRE